MTAHTTDVPSQTGRFRRRVPESDTAYDSGFVFVVVLPFSGECEYEGSEARVDFEVRGGFRQIYRGKASTHDFHFKRATYFHGEGRKAFVVTDAPGSVRNVGEHFVQFADQVHKLVDPGPARAIRSWVSVSWNLSIQPPDPPGGWVASARGLVGEGEGAAFPSGFEPNIGTLPTSPNKK